MNKSPRIMALLGGTVLFGQERGNIEALATLRESGYDILCLVCSADADHQIIPALEARGLKWRKVPYIEHRIPGRLHYTIMANPFRFILANMIFCWEVARFRPAYIHACNPLYVMNFLVGLSVWHIPIIYRAGDQPILHNPIWRLTWAFITRRAAHFVANSRFVAQSIVNAGAPPRRVSVIYNAPPKRVPAKLLVGNLVGPRSQRVAFVGQICEHKGTHLLITAFRSIAHEFPDATLVIAGRLTNWSWDAWARKLQNNVSLDPQLRDRVTFLGEVEDIETLLDQSAFLVVPSVFDDPSPNVVMEAKRAGRPAIVFPRGGMPELIESGVDGLVCDEPTEAALSKALRVYLGDEDVTQRHGAAAKRSMVRLGIDHFAQSWLGVYSARDAD